MKYILSILLSGIIGGLIVLFSIQYITSIQEQLSLQPVSQNQTLTRSETGGNINPIISNGTHNTSNSSPNTLLTPTTTTPSNTVKRTNHYSNATLAQLNFTRASEKTLPTEFTSPLK